MNIQQVPRKKICNKSIQFLQLNLINHLIGVRMSTYLIFFSNLINFLTLEIAIWIINVLRFVYQIAIQFLLRYNLMFGLFFVWYDITITNNILLNQKNPLHFNSNKHTLNWSYAENIINKSVKFWILALFVLNSKSLYKFCCMPFFIKQVKCLQIVINFQKIDSVKLEDEKRNFVNKTFE